MMSLTNIARIASIAVLCSVSFGCEPSSKMDELNTNDSTSTSQDGYVVGVELVDGALIFSLPNGSTYAGLEAYSSAAVPLFAELLTGGSKVEFALGPSIQEEFHSATPSDVVAGSFSEQAKSEFSTAEMPLYIGYGYNLTTSYGYKYVSGCVKKNTNRLAIRLNKGSAQVFDMHAAFYMKNGKPCFGLYESVSGWTKCMCGPTYKQVKDAVIEAVMYVGISYAVAAVIADVVTPLILALAAA